MEIALSNIPTGQREPQPNANQGLAGVGGQDFINILIKQLQYQDPFEPMGNQEMLAQLATIRELELTTRLSSKIEQLTDQQRFGSVAVLIGKYVTGEVLDSEGETFVVEGIVAGVRFTSRGQVMLELDTGETMPLSKLRTVTEPDE